MYSRLYFDRMLQSRHLGAKLPLNYQYLGLDRFDEYIFNEKCYFGTFHYTVTTEFYICQLIKSNS